MISAISTFFSLPTYGLRWSSKEEIIQKGSKTAFAAIAMVGLCYSISQAEAGPIAFGVCYADTSAAHRNP